MNRYRHPIELLVLLLLLAGCGGGGADEDIGASEGQEDPRPMGVEFAWAQRLAGESDLETITPAASMPDGTVLIAGHQRLSMVLGEGQLNETTIAPVGTHSTSTVGWVARYAASGLLLSVQRLGDGVVPIGIAVAPDGSYFVAGRFFREITWFAGTPQATSHAPEGWASFVAKFGVSGAPVWLRIVDGDGFDRIRTLATLDDGGVAVAGNASPGAVVVAGDAPLSTVDGYEDGYVARYSAAGTPLWVQWLGGVDEYQSPTALAQTPWGDLAVGGVFEEEISFDVGGPNAQIMTAATGQDAFVATYGPSGFLRGAVHIEQVQSSATIKGIDVLASGRVVAAGSGTATAFPAVGEGRTFLWAFDESLQTVWLRRPGGSVPATPLPDGGYVQVSSSREVGAPTSTVIARFFSEDGTSRGSAELATTGIHGPQVSVHVFGTDLVLSGRFVQWLEFSPSAPSPSSQLTAVNGERDPFLARFSLVELE